jgi:hypothetical protein
MLSSPSLSGREVTELLSGEISTIFGHFRKTSSEMKSD